MNRFQGLKAHLRRIAGLTLALLMGLGTLAVPAMAEEDTSVHAVPLIVTPAETAEKMQGLNGTSIAFDLYQITGSKMNSSGSFDFPALEEYSSLQTAIDNMVKKTNPVAEDVEPIAKDAGKIAIPNANIKPVRTQTLAVAGDATSMTFDNTGSPALMPGLYLVVARDTVEPVDKYYDDTAVTTHVNTADEVYTFPPFLTYLPGEGQIGETYDIKIFMKPTVSDRLADLQIIKNLPVYETKDPVTFVFKITGKDKTDPNKTIYTNIRSYSFNGPGTQNSIVIKDIPVGSVFTVEEVYSGQNYRIDVEENKTVQVKIGPYRYDEVNKLCENHAEFTNVYDETYRGGGATINNYTARGKGNYDSPKEPYTYDDGHIKEEE